MKPKCKLCEFLDINYHSDECYCMHPKADGEQIFFDYPQQRRPKWCPKMEKDNAPTLIEAEEETE